MGDTQNLPRVIEALPGFDVTQFPDLPVADLQGGLLIPYTSPWGHAEHELAAAAMVSFCIEKGAWWPLAVDELNAYLTRTTHSLVLRPAEVYNAQVQMIMEGDIERLFFEDQVLLAPTAQLARKFLEQSRPMIFPGKTTPAAV